MSEFRDPLDELLQKHKDSEEHKPINDEEVVELNESVSQEEDIYGDNDIELEMKQEEEQDRVLHEQMVQEHIEAKKESEEFYQKAPGRSLDPQFIDESVSFQADKIEDVNLMVQKVLAEKEIYEGYFPADKKMHILGDLMEEYHKAVGVEPTQKFKDIVLRNWISPNKMREDAEKNVEKDDKPAFSLDDIKEYLNNGPVVNIKTTGDAPVTVNVDDSIIPDISETRKVEINIITVEEKEGSLATIIEDANVDDILNIEPQETAINNVPFTTVYSGYRAVVMPMNWFDYLKLASPSSHNASDALIQKWSNIYKHLLSTSIGKFETFDDFLKHTMFDDLELFEWALFVATSSDTEIITYPCNHQIGTKKVEKTDEDGNIIYDEDGNSILVDAPELCNNEVRYEYNPRSVIELDTERLPAYYEEVHNAVVGEHAMELHKKIIGTKQQLTLPDSKYKLNISRSSAYDYIYKKLPIIVDLCGEYDIPFSQFERYMQRNPVGSLYILCAVGIDAIIVPRNGNEYKFTKWNDIRKIVDTLSNDDIQVIMKVFEERNTKPFDFNFHNIECSECHHVVETLPVGSLFELMGFNLTRRLQNTEINLIDIASN